jgi:hypothetical protein
LPAVLPFEAIPSADFVNAMINSYETVILTVPTLVIATKLFGVNATSKNDDPPTGAQPH